MSYVDASIAIPGAACETVDAVVGTGDVVLDHDLVVETTDWEHAVASEAGNSILRLYSPGCP